MAQGGGSQAATVAAEQASQQPGNSLLQHMNFRGHEAEAVNQEQPEHILGKTFDFYFLNRIVIQRMVLRFRTSSPLP